ncbi:hypothetical protein B0H19DRAFT_1267721 [Mycena capillaripes]|nr:hypothetical protein B0H19DRAFT_1267721 [Mycena capillaripes]
MPAAIEHYPAAYETLVQGKAIKCVSTGTTFTAMPPPAALILDIFTIQQLHITRSITGTAIPVFMFLAGNAGSSHVFPGVNGWIHLHTDGTVIKRPFEGPVAALHIASKYRLLSPGTPNLI